MTAPMEKPQNLSLSETRTFGFMLLAGSLVAGSLWTGLIYLLRDTWNIAILFYFLGIGGGIALLCILLPKPLQPFHRAWLTGTRWMEIAVTTLLLTVFYYFILFPVALCLRLFGHRSFIKKGSHETESYWEPVESEPKPEDYYRQY